jgi:hypothetical protein
MVKKVMLAFAAVLCIIMSAFFADAFSVVYSGTCTPSQSNLYVYNATGALVKSEAHTGSITGCWDAGFYVIEVDSTNITQNTPVSFYLGGVFAGENAFSYTENTDVTLNLEDSSAPNITLVSPDDGNLTTEHTIVFNYIVTDDTGIANCSLYIDGNLNQTDSSVSNNTLQSFSLTLADGSYTWQIRCYDSTSYTNLGLSDVYDLDIITYGKLSCGLVNPSSDKNVTKGRSFNFTVQTNCTVGNCGTVTVSLDPLAHKKSWLQSILDWLGNAITGLAAGTLVSTTYGANPFYTLDANPDSCGTMTNGESCTSLWRVNSTGDAGDYEFYALCNSSYSAVLGNQTEHINITIQNNSASSVSSVNVTKPAFTDTMIYCDADYSDPENDTIILYYTWYVDGGIATEHDNSLDCGITPWCLEGANVTCVVTPFDGSTNGTSMNDSVIISNSPPSSFIPNICMAQNDSAVIDLDSYSNDLDNDDLSWTNTNSTNVNATINSTTHEAKFTSGSGIGIEYLNFTVADEANSTTQPVAVTVAPASPPSVLSINALPSHVPRTQNITVLCDGTPSIEATLNPIIQYKKHSDLVWQNTTEHYDGSHWVANVLTGIADSWLGVYDFRCGFTNCLYSSANFSVLNGTVLVANNNPSIVLNGYPPHVNISTNYNVTIKCNSTDVEDTAPYLDVNIRYQLPGSAGWRDCSEKRSGSSWSCRIAGNDSSLYRGAWDIRCISTDTDGGSSTNTVFAGVNVSANPPVINLPANFTITKFTPEELLNLSDYSSDAEDANSLLTYAVVNMSNSSIALCYANVQKYLVCIPTLIGKTNVTVAVYDTDNMSANDTILIDVVSINRRPVLSNESFNSGTAFVSGDSVSCEAILTDPDNDNIDLVDSYIWADDNSASYYSGNLTTMCTGSSWSAGKLCTWTVINVSGGKGLWHCDWLAVDNYSKFDFSYLNNTMGNAPPQLTPLPYVSVVEGHTLSLTLDAYDPDALDNLTFSDNVSYGIINSTSGHFTWAPGVLDIGLHNVTFSVSDGNASDSIVTTIEVYSSYCSNCPVMFIGRCQVGGGDIDVIDQDGQIVAHETYGSSSGCVNNNYDIIVQGGPEPGCDVQLGETIRFFVHGDEDGNYTFSCSPSLVNFNLSTGPSVCGNSQVESGEQCDLANLDGQDCQDRGYSSGTLSCTANCTFNTGNCRSSGGGGGGRHTSSCVPIWQCADWGECQPTKSQTRECIDLNKCNTDSFKPATFGRCAYIAGNCFDAALNGDESDIDCGGHCGSNCVDNRRCNKNSDCVSNSCDNNICVSCNDYKQNQGETDVDCGGPCKACAKIEIPKPVCDDRVSSWHIMLLMMLISAGMYYGDKYYRVLAAKKGLKIPVWLDTLKQEPLVNIVVMIFLLLISILSVILDNACFEDCLGFKSKYLLTIISLLASAGFGWRAYRMYKGLAPIKISISENWQKAGIMGGIVVVIIGAAALNAYFTNTCLIQDSQSQVPGTETSPLVWFIPMLIVLISTGAVMTYLLVKEYRPDMFAPRTPRAGPEAPAPKIEPKLPEVPEPPKLQVAPEIVLPKKIIVPKQPKLAKPRLKQGVYAPKFRELASWSEALKLLKAEIEQLFVDAYEALARGDFDEVQRIASILSRKYRTLPRDIRDDVYHEIMILYDQIEKKLL